MNLRVSIVRWISDEPQPGWVEAEFADAVGRLWRIEDKPPILSAHSIGPENLPTAGTVEGTITGVHLDSQLRLVASIKSTLVRTTDGFAEFEVFTDQLDGEPSPDERRKLHRYDWLAEFDRDTLRVAIKVAREHDSSFDDKTAEPFFADDLNDIVESMTGSRPSGSRMAWIRLRHPLPTDRGRVGGRPFWFRRDLQRWAAAIQARRHRGSPIGNTPHLNLVRATETTAHQALCPPSLAGRT